MYAKLEGVEQRFNEVEQHLSDPGLIGNREAYQKAVREHSDLGKIVTVFRRHKEVAARIQESRELLNDADADIRNMAKEELAALTAEQAQLESDLMVLLLPKDPNDDKNVILEIRAGTGGDEAGLFASDLFRMYCRYAEGRSWKIEILSGHPSGAGGVKEAIVMIQGKGAYSALKYESGIHRVQRVPATEAQGRIHTSAVTVAVLPEAEEVDVAIHPNDLRIDVYRSGGPGGQSVNTTDSAVRVTHLPTGLVVICQDEKSQLKNKNKALKVLRARLLDAKIQEQDQQRSEERKSQVGSGDRSGRIRTYNFPQSRVTDHRIGLTLHRLEAILQGEIQELIDGLTTHYQTQALQNVEPAASR
ncbi:MAG TPA: peptide chain release factor 1 [Desulfobacterales bacterium]|nr:peptide chain release factor 1 [Desulfobacterales bacterium]